MSWEWYNGKWMTSNEANEHRSGGAVLTVIGAICIGTFMGIKKLIEFACAWQEHAVPLKQVAAWYYFGVVLPGKYLLVLIASPWFLVYKNSLTRYPNLNLVLAIISIILIVTLLTMAIWMAFRKWGRRIFLMLIIALFGPLIFVAFWALYRWLTAN